MPSDKIELTVILPAFNEESEIYESVQEVVRRIQELDVTYEVIIVDDGSKDETLKKARQCASELKNVDVITYEDNRGKGYAVQQGMLQAKGENRLFMDVDLSTSLDEIEKVLNTIRLGSFDVVMGSRRMNESLLKIQQPLHRQVVGFCFKLIAIALVGRKFTDFTCGFKMFTKKAAEIIFKRQKKFGWAFDTEVILIAVVHSLHIHEVPVTWSDSRDSRVRLLRDIPKCLAELVSMKVNQIRGDYK